MADFMACHRTNHFPHKVKGEGLENQCLEKYYGSEQKRTAGYRTDSYYQRKTGQGETGKHDVRGR